MFSANQDKLLNPKKLKSKFCGIPGVFALVLDRFSKFITKGPIFWKIGSSDLIKENYLGNHNTNIEYLSVTYDLRYFLFFVHIFRNRRDIN